MIRENVRQGFIQTQSKVNKWINDFSKRINGEEEDENNDLYAPPAGAPPQRQNFGASQKDQLRGIRKNAEAAAWQQGRRSTDHERYDADPRVLSDNFSELELKDEGSFTLFYNCHPLDYKLTSHAQKPHHPSQIVH